MCVVVGGYFENEVVGLIKCEIKYTRIVTVELYRPKISQIGNKSDLEKLRILLPIKIYLSSKSLIEDIYETVNKK